MRSWTHRQVWLGLVALWTISLGCDPLLDRPRTPPIAVAISAPVDGSSLVQPGPRVAFVVEVQGCKELRSLQLLNNTKVVASAEGQQLDPKRVVFDIDLNTLLTATDWDYDFRAGTARALRFSARAECADFDQAVGSEIVSVAISPWTSLRVGPTGARAVHPLEEETNVLVEGEGHLELWQLDRDGLGLKALKRVAVDDRGPGKLLRVGGDTYLWKRCVLCFATISGSLYRLQLPELQFLGQWPLECPPVALSEWPGLGVLVVAHEGCAATRTVTTMAKSTLEPLANAGEPGGGLLTGLATRSDGERVGLAHDGSSPAKARIFSTIDSSTGWTERADITFDLEQTAATIEPHGTWAAWLETKAGRLHWLPIDVPNRRARQGEPVERKDVGPWDERAELIAWEGRRVVIVGDDRVEVHQMGHDARLWQRDFSAGVLAALPASAKRLVVLTYDLNVFELDENGRIVAEQGAVSDLGIGAPNVAVVGGFFHYVIISRGRYLVASYRLTADDRQVL